MAMMHSTITTTLIKRMGEVRYSSVCYLRRHWLVVFGPLYAFVALFREKEPPGTH